MERTGDNPADGIRPASGRLMEAFALSDREGLQAAEAMLRASADEAATAYGESSAAHCNALTDVALLLMNRGARSRAVEVMRDVCARPLADDWNARRERTTSLKLLGETLAKTGDFAAAEPFFQASIDLRREVYGEGSVALAFGLEGLAEACLEAGKKKRALRLCDEALEHCIAHNDVHVVPLWLLRAEVLAALGREPLLPAAEVVSDQLLGLMLQQTIRSTHIREAGLGPQVIQAVIDLLDAREQDHPARGMLMRTKAQAAGRNGDAALRTRTLHELAGFAQQHGNTHGALVLRLDMAASAAEHDAHAARESFERAIADAAALGPKPSYLAHHAYAVFLAARRQRKSAAAQLRAAVAAAVETTDRYAEAAARMALAAFLAEGDRDDEARAELERAAPDLPPDERRASTVRITAPEGIVERVRGDDCGSMAQLVPRFLFDTLQRDLPGGLALREVVIGDEGWIEARCGGPLGPAERAALERALAYRAAEQAMILAEAAAHPATEDADDEGDAQVAGPKPAPIPRAARPDAPLPTGLAPRWDPSRFRGPSTP